MSINKQQTEESELLERKLEAKVEDELYMLNYEDIVAGMPTRFKYRQGEINSCGLSTEEIIFARDSTLKQFVSLKNWHHVRSKNTLWEARSGADFGRCFSRIQKRNWLPPYRCWILMKQISSQSRLRTKMCPVIRRRARKKASASHEDRQKSNIEPVSPRSPSQKLSCQIQ